MKDFVGNYESLRIFLRHILRYGTFTVDDFEKAGISASYYNQMKRKVEAVMPETLEYKSHGKQRKKALHVKTDTFTDSFSELTAGYLLKSITQKELILTLAILQNMKSEEALNAEEIEQMLIDIGDSEEDFSISHTGLLRILAQMTEFGLLICEERPQRYYHIAENPLFKLSKEEFQHLYLAVDYFQHLLYPSACGKQMLSTMDFYRKETGETSFESPFLFKALHISYLLDDAILWNLLNAIETSCLIEFDYRKLHYKEILPVKIVCCEEIGRRFLFAVNLFENRRVPLMLRLDAIFNLKIGDISEALTTEEKNALYKKSLSHSYNGAHLLTKEPEQITLLIDSNFIDNFSKNFPDSVLQKEENGKFLASVTVNQAIELKPYLRRFAQHVKPCANTRLAEEMNEELKKWRKLYGIIS